MEPDAELSLMAGVGFVFRAVLSDIPAAPATMENFMQGFIRACSFVVALGGAAVVQAAAGDDGLDRDQARLQPLIVVRLIGLHRRPLPYATGH